MLLKTLSIVLTFPSMLFPKVLSLWPNQNLWGRQRQFGGKDAGLGGWGWVGGQ